MNVRELTREFVRAYNEHDIDGVASLYAQTGEHREIAQNTARRGPAEIGAGFAHFLDAFPDAHWREEHVLCDGSLAAVSYHLTGSLRGRLGPFEPGGQRLDMRGMHLLCAGAGRLAWTADYWDAATFARQMRERDGRQA
jgi:ketosteroid isomerase-like protein